MKKILKRGLVLVGVIVLVMLMCKLNEQETEVLNSCIENTGNKTYCERSVLGVY